MARIYPNDLIKGMSGKVCSHSDEYFTMNASSGKVFTGKRCSTSTHEATEKQLNQQSKFKAMAQAATAWLNANKPSEANGTKGTADYQKALKLKFQLQYSNVRQVVCRYMNPATLEITIGSRNWDNAASEDPEEETPQASSQYTITAKPEVDGYGTVSPASSTVNSGESVTLTATASSGYTFTKWSDGSTENPRTVTATENKEYVAVFTADEDEDDGATM